MLRVCFVVSLPLAGEEGVALADNLRIEKGGKGGVLLSEPFDGEVATKVGFV